MAKYEPLADDELKALERIDVARGWVDGTPGGAGLCIRAATEIRELRDYKQMAEDNADELEKCNAELIADNARLRETLESIRDQTACHTEACGPEYRDRGLHSPSCRWDLAEECDDALAGKGDDHA